jgi:hypothetical protein
LESYQKDEHKKKRNCLGWKEFLLSPKWKFRTGYLTSKVGKSRIVKVDKK